MSILQSKMLKNIFPDIKFWKMVLVFALPIALQNMSSAILGIIDVSVISDMGETAVAAVSHANQLFYIVSLITFGITSGASVYLSRFFGEKNPDKTRETFSITLFFSLLINLIIMLFCLFLPEIAIGFFTNDAQTIEYGAIYLLIITPTFLLYSLSNSYVAFFRSAKQTKIPMIGTIISLGAKVLLNYVFIYGFGFIPALGVAGAAISTLISKIIEALIYLVSIARFEQREYVFKLSDIMYFKPVAVFDFIQKTYAVILNESLWGFGVSAFNAIFGRMGNVAVSAVSIARQLENLGNAFFYGIAIGACVTISCSIGEKKIGEAKEFAKKYALAGFWVGVFIMVLMLAIDAPYVKFFFSSLEAETQSLAIWLIAIYALYMPFRSLASTLIMGVMRAGGDSRKAMLYDVVPVYAWSLVLGFILGIKLKYSIITVLAVMMFKRFIKCAFALKRVASGKWLEYDELDANEEPENNTTAIV